MNFVQGQVKKHELRGCVKCTYCLLQFTASSLDLTGTLSYCSC